MIFLNRLSIYSKLMLSYLIVAMLTASAIYLLIVMTVATSTNPSVEEQVYLQSSHQILFLAMMMGIGIALLVGHLIARIFLRPIYTLTAATGTIATDNLQQEVPIYSQDELGQLARHFNTMRREVTQANQQHRQMTANIAHDLGTPLQIIAGYIETIQDGTLSPTPERIKIIADEIELLRRLTNDLDILAQSDAKTLLLNRETINIHHYLTQIVTRFQPIASQQHINLQLINTDVSLVIHADSERLAQVMRNLIENALRHTPQHGSIHLSAKKRLDSIQICIQDTGAGIAAEDLPFIFNRFYQVDQIRDDSRKMGLGLSISQALIEAMSGQIMVVSEGLNQGTRFTIILPQSS